jgi:hypothetical protein
MRHLLIAISPFALAAVAGLAMMVSAVTNPAVAETKNGDSTMLVSEVDGCRTWRVSDDLGQGGRYAKLEARKLYFTKCFSNGDDASKPQPVKGDIPANASIIAEVDGCRVWRVSEEQEKTSSSATIEPFHLYYARCNGVIVPVTEAGMR